ncbi:MAG: hypothetical protein JW976_12700 [Syntrophaceae bacterium]|nr:hypothetical protein [Syntrophaceae bacterium]
MMDLKHSVSFMIIFAITMVFIGCAKPPEAEKSAAIAAMDAAVSSGADEYAVADMGAAKAILETAENQMKEKKYKEAKQGYLAAKAAFDKAAVAAEEGKKLAAAEQKKSGYVAVWTAQEKLAKGQAVAKDSTGAKASAVEPESITKKEKIVKPTPKAKTETTTAAVKVPATQNVKVIGNRDSKRYHLPGMKYYNAVKAYHRVEFNSEADAIKAGYHKAPR